MSSTSNWNTTGTFWPCDELSPSFLFHLLLTPFTYSVTNTHQTTKLLKSERSCRLAVFFYSFGLWAFAAEPVCWVLSASSIVTVIVTTQCTLFEMSNFQLTTTYWLFWYTTDKYILSYSINLHWIGYSY